jgi:hypothetical protein
VQVLPAAKLGDKGFRSKDKLRLKLIRKLVKMSDQVPANVLATARRGQVLQQRFERLEDGRVQREAERAAVGSAVVPPPAIDCGGAAAVQRGVGEGSRAVERLGRVEERVEELNQELEKEEEDGDDEAEWNSDYFADKYEDVFY